ncbi:hypothetical protein B0H14DRAFT_2980980, partial [Mycena olivaceomarginata]
MFGERAMTPFFGCEILDHLSLPSLETLLANAMPDTLLSFLRRSSPPLQELVLGDESDFPRLAECLQPVPDLRRLEMWYPTAEAVFAGLAESPTLLPHVNALVLHVTENDISDSFGRCYTARSSPAVPDAYSSASQYLAGFPTRRCLHRASSLRSEHWRWMGSRYSSVLQAKYGMSLGTRKCGIIHLP